VLGLVALCPNAKWREDKSQKMSIKFFIVRKCSLKNVVCKGPKHPSHRCYTASNQDIKPDGIFFEKKFFLGVREFFFANFD
jgi:hypothetical protein